LFFAPIFLSAALAATPPTASSPSSTTKGQALPRASIEALHLALEDERRAEAFYAAVIQKQGEVRPFSNIIEAERRHQCALENLYKTHGLPIPPNPWKDKKVDVPATFEACCEAGATAEIENVSLYDRLLKTVSEPEVRAVFEQLRWASRERHLPAFRRHSGR
jgi:rubrerythrin